MISLVFRDGQPHSFNLNLITWLSDYFHLEPYKENKKYDKKCVFLNNSLIYDGWAEHLVDLGHIVVLDNLWEIKTSRTGMYTLHSPFWFWYHEYYYNISRGLDQYVPTKNVSRRCFLPIRNPRYYREYLLNRLQQRLEQCLWSYPGKKSLPNDSYNEDGSTVDRWFDPYWYDSTSFSIVAESHCDQVFITEKTFKPIAFWHPFMIVSGSGHLELLKTAGFVTYDNIFDESYDLENDIEKKIDIITKNFDSYSNEYDTETLRRMEHNHGLFYDSATVKQRIIEEIVLPLTTLVETH